MRGKTFLVSAFFVSLCLCVFVFRASSQTSNPSGALLTLQSRYLKRPLTLDGLFYETAQGRISIPALPGQARGILNRPYSAQATMPDGRVVTVSVVPQANDFAVSLTARPNTGIVRWGLAV